MLNVGLSDRSPRRSGVADRPSAADAAPVPSSQRMFVWKSEATALGLESWTVAYACSPRKMRCGDELVVPVPASDASPGPW